MENLVYEIVKEFKILVQNLDYVVKGKILKRIKGDDGLNVEYSWEVSHYYKPLDGTEVYRTSQTSAQSLERAEILLLNYTSAFTNEDVQENSHY